jgi:5S rRNA maturation endonuclease (ribonuclease M5)
VEGFTDALAIYQISEGDILVLGTAYNYNKVNIEEIKRYYEEIYIATDNDEMGNKAYIELKKLLPNSKRYSYEGKDPMEAYLRNTLKNNLGYKMDNFGYRMDKRSL